MAPIDQSRRQATMLPRYRLPRDQMYAILDFGAFGCKSMEDSLGQSVFTGLGFEQSNTKTIDTSSEISHSSAKVGLK